MHCKRVQITDIVSWFECRVQITARWCNELRACCGLFLFYLLVFFHFIVIACWGADARNLFWAQIVVTEIVRGSRVLLRWYILTDTANVLKSALVSAWACTIWRNLHRRFIFKWVITRDGARSTTYTWIVNFDGRWLVDILWVIAAYFERLLSQSFAQSFRAKFLRTASEFIHFLTWLLAQDHAWWHMNVLVWAWRMDSRQV